MSGVDAVAARRCFVGWCHEARAEESSAEDGPRAARPIDVSAEANWIVEEVVGVKYTPAHILAAHEGARDTAEYWHWLLKHGEEYVLAAEEEREMIARDAEQGGFR